MITEDEYKNLKAQVEAARQAAERAQGALDQLVRQLKEQYHCGDLPSAENLLTELRGKTIRAERKFDTAYKDYMKKYGPGNRSQDGGED